MRDVPVGAHLPGEERVGFPITVAAHAVLRLQHAVTGLANARVEIVRTVPVARSGEVTVWFALTRAAIVPVMLAALRGLETAQFGRVAML